MISNRLTTIDDEVFQRYAGLSLPRHVSYPMPTWWRDAEPGDPAAMRHSMADRTEPVDLSLYVHVPFCEALCKFCACCRIVQRKTAPGADERTDSYVSALLQEIASLGEQFGQVRPLRQIHWGGGTPTYLSDRDMERIAHVTADAFTIAEDAEISIEVDPRVVSADSLAHLRRLGFNRISLGVQDFDPKVQEHVKRIQPFDMVRETVDTCRNLGFVSVNFDLIYGLPYQTLESVADTLEKCIELSPDRVAYYHYAQIPEKIATQRVLHHDAMPDSETKLSMFLLGVERFNSAGYDFVGLDHFAKADEMLAEAAKNGTLQRNFQGMTTGGGLDLIGAGASSISQLLRIGFLQNVRDPDGYVEALNTNGTALNRAKQFTEDDCIRQAVISQVYCGARIVPHVMENQFGIDFARYFQRELDIVKELAEDGLVLVHDDNEIELTFPLGRVLMRNVAAVFDAYLHPEAYRLGEQHCFSVNA